ncbi:hypothetical protein LTS18_012997, partial [Coniosporium uncinatum]
MLRASSQLCIFCETRSLLNITRPSWQQSRAASQGQRRRIEPARHELSPRVAQSYRPLQGAKPVRKSRNSPFASMNQTRDPFRNGDTQQRPQRSEAELRRSTRGQKQPDKKDNKGEYRALKMQRSLTNVSYGRRNAIKSRIQEVDAFGQFPLLPIILESITPQALKGMTDVMPTPVQRLAIPALLGTDGFRRRQASSDEIHNFDQFLLAAETGSGKTLAYLLPIIDAIKRAEAIEAQQAKREDAQRQKEEQEKQQRNVFG